MPDYQRDVTLSGGSNDYFVAPGSYDYWLYNAPANAVITVSKAGKAPITISPGEVLVIHLTKGEELAISGTAGQTLTILDKSDVKLIPTSKDILGKFQITDATGNIATIAGTSPNFALEVILVDPTIGAKAAVSTTQPSGIKAGLVVTWPTGNAVLQKPLATPVEAESFLGSVAGSTAETVETAGSTTLAAGTRIFYSLSTSPGPLTTAGDVLTYVALKSHTGAVYLAICLLPGSVSGSFDLEQTVDKIDIVVRNQDTVAHGFAGAWQAMTP